MTNNTTEASINDTLFARATRDKLHFDSARGPLNVEQLWDVPLLPATTKAANGTPEFSLDKIAKDINRELKEAGEESFVQTVKNPKRDLLALKLDVVKAIISVLAREAALKRQESDRKRELAALTEALAEKEADERKSLGKDEIKARIAALSS